MVSLYELEGLGLGFRVGAWGHMRVPFSGVSIVGIIVYWRASWGSLYL